MNYLRKLFNNINFVLILLLSFLAILSFESEGNSSFLFLQKDRIYENSGLFSLIEFIQLILLLLNVFYIFKFKSFLIKKAGNLKLFIIRLLIPIILFLEEISFFLKDYLKFTGLDKINSQGEVNIHNLDILNIQIFKNLPILGEFDISLKFTLYSLICMTFAFGQFIPFLKNYEFIFFEKKLIIFAIVYILNILLSYTLRSVGFINGEILGNEFIEIFYYQLLLIDIKQKIFKRKIS